MGNRGKGPAPLQEPVPDPKPTGPNDHPDGNTPPGPGRHRDDK